MLLVDKRAGPTSHDVVAIARRATGERRIGHAGTLDPFATGLLVLLLGRGTRLLPYIDGEPKVYEAEILFGNETDTDDLTGVITVSASIPELATIERTIADLTGDIVQLPPAYSAKKVAGRRAHEAARAGAPVALRPVPVRVHRWEVAHWADARLRVTITCGGGTYIRALARDLGRGAGSAAHLVALRRLRSGPFDVRDAIPVDALDRDVVPLPLRQALSSMDVLPLDRAEARRISSGMRIPASGAATRVALLAPGGDLLAIADREGDEWQPKLVLA